MDETGVFRSEVFPGLWLDAATMIRGHTATALKVLAEGLASNEHEEFVKHLQPTT
jgi:hypothetical protein